MPCLPMACRAPNQPSATRERHDQRLQPTTPTEAHTNTGFSRKDREPLASLRDSLWDYAVEYLRGSVRYVAHVKPETHVLPASVLFDGLLRLNYHKRGTEGGNSKTGKACTWGANVIKTAHPEPRAPSLFFFAWTPDRRRL
jgi:hypothetical protein